ncbi:MAG: acyl-CoA dehydrogenase [Xanthomonadaceae bacterium]|nr:acyl-CoA dehydrogenase [Xanthomonadaceae bacterium]
MMIILILFLALGFIGAPLYVWTAAIAGLFYYLDVTQTYWITFGVIVAIFNLPPLRTIFFSTFVAWTFKKLQLMPKISQTESIALKAGDVWIEKELFSGKPNFKRILDQKYPELTVEEQSYIDGPVERLCAMINDFEIWRTRKIPDEVFNFMKKEKIFGMIIPKEYGGLGFSALAHSEVILKLSSRSMPITVTAMVPNSLGPAELLVHYGTDEQKKKLLPRLATGEEIPCFALTEPGAGSDAGSIQASGHVFKDSSGQVMLRLNWNKRWITLAAQSTILGLAFRLYDPENLLGKGKDPGITCALIPSHTPGITADRRHDPMYIPFVNSPTQGHDVIVPLDVIIGGPDRVGEGWSMLMDCLGAGRGISLPAQAAGVVKYATRVSSAHSVVRKQFGMSIGQFEGVSEKLGKMGGYSYLVEAARLYTVGALDSNTKPPIVTAIMKHYSTEIGRTAINYAMDVVAGAAVVVGPRNLLAHAYIATPVSITVEGANILTRTLMIFGQGALRAHPYAFAEMDSLERGDMRGFDRAFTGHMGHIIRNMLRWLLLSLSRGWLTISPRMGVTALYYRKLAWASATYAFLVDFFMISLGAKLKAKGKITGRMADIIGWMYLATATLRRFEAEGRKKEDEPFLRWAMDQSFYEIQVALDGLFASVEIPLIGFIFTGPIRWLHALNPIGRPTSDALELKISQLIQTPGAQRDRITGRIFIPKNKDEYFRKLEDAFQLNYTCLGTEKKVKSAVRSGKLKKKPMKELLADALSSGVITKQEFDDLARIEEIRNDVIQVDSFSQEEYVKRT